MLVGPRWRSAKAAPRSALLLLASLLSLLGGCLYSGRICTLRPELYSCHVVCERDGATLLDALPWGPAEEGTCFAALADASAFCDAQAQFEQNILNDNARLQECRDVATMSFVDAISCDLDADGVADVTYDVCSLLGLAGLSCVSPGRFCAVDPLSACSGAFGAASALAVAMNPTATCFPVMPAEAPAANQALCTVGTPATCTATLDLATAPVPGCQCTIAGCPTSGPCADREACWESNCGADLCSLLKPSVRGVSAVTVVPSPSPDVCPDLLDPVDPPIPTIQGAEWVFTLDAALSSLTLAGATSAASGTVALDGGDCPGATCPVTFRAMSVLQLDRLDLGPGGALSVEDGRLRNHDVVDGTVSSGALFFETGTVVLVLDWMQRDMPLDPFTPNSAVVLNDQPLVGSVDFAAGTLDLVGTFTLDTGGAAFVLHADLTNQPPVADAGADQIVSCSDTAMLSALGSTDPDGPADLRTYRWSRRTPEGDTVFVGVSPTPTVNLTVGVNEFVLEVRDANGTMDTDSVIVERVDRPPLVDVAVAPDCLWPANHRYVPFELGADILVDVSDDCDASPDVFLLGATSSEPDDGAQDGSTAKDVARAAGVLCLRAERRSGGPGRTYAVRVAAIDSAGNLTFSEAAVRVPRDGGRGGCDGPLPADSFVNDGDPPCGP
jgi:hypothetical protein